MIHKFERKILILLCGLFFLSLYVLLTAVQLLYVNENRTTVSKMLLKSLSEEAGASGGEDDILSDTGSPWEITQLSSIYIVSLRDGALVLEGEAEASPLSEDEVLALAEEMFLLHDSSGVYERYQYEYASSAAGFSVAFFDISDIRISERNMLLSIIMAGAAVYVLLFFVFLRLSRWLVRPLSEAMRKQSDFILAAGHELKTPLAVMRTSLDLMEKDGISSKYLGYAREEGGRMQQLIGRMLDLSQIEAMGEAAVTDEIDLSGCIEHTCLPFEALAYEKGIEMDLEVEQGLYVRGDAARIGELAGILLDNALQHTAAGGHVRISLKKGGSGPLFSVQNEGDPIPEDRQEKIFEPFYRMDKARGRDAGRYGLGLAIAQKIANTHGTQINVHCAGGVTEFSIGFKAR